MPGRLTQTCSDRRRLHDWIISVDLIDEAEVSDARSKLLNLTGFFSSFAGAAATGWEVPMAAPVDGIFGGREV